MPDRRKQLALGLAAYQVADAVGNAMVPRRYIDSHLDHLRVPSYLRPALSGIKVTTSVGLVVGLKVPRIGALTSAGLVAYYTAAVGFHVLAHDHPVVALPAAALGAGAAVALFSLYLPSVESRSDDGSLDTAV